MAVAEQDLPFTPDQVWAAVSDPRTYPEWLVGAEEILAVDPHWPDPGAEFRHRVGLFGPLTVSDRTESEAVDPPHRLVVLARARPFGRARVVMALRPSDGGTRMSMEEHPIGVVAPLDLVAQPLIVARNRRSMRRLAQHLAERS